MADMPKKDAEELKKTKEGRTELEQIRTEAIASAAPYIPALQAAYKKMRENPQSVPDNRTPLMKGYFDARDRVEWAITKVMGQHGLDASEQRTDDANELQEQDRRTVNNQNFCFDIITTIQNPGQTKEPNKGPGQTPGNNQPQRNNNTGRGN